MKKAVWFGVSLLIRGLAWTSACRGQESVVGSCSVQGNQNIVQCGSNNTVIYNDITTVSKLLERRVTPIVARQTMLAAKQDATNVELRAQKSRIDDLQQQLTQFLEQGNKQGLAETMRAALEDPTLNQKTHEAVLEHETLRVEITRVSNPQVRKKAEVALAEADFEKVRSLINPAFAAIAAPVAVAGGLAFYTGTTILIVAAANGGKSHGLVTPAWIATASGLAVGVAAIIPTAIYIDEKRPPCGTCETVGDILKIGGGLGLGAALVMFCVSMDYGAEALANKVSLMSTCNDGVCPTRKVGVVEALHNDATTSDKWLLLSGVFAGAGTAVLVSGLVLGSAESDTNASSRKSSKAVTLQPTFGPLYGGVRGVF